MPTIQTADAATDVLFNFFDSATRPTYAALSESSNIPLSTWWDRAHGRRPRREKAAKQQYLTPQEEKALVNYALRMSRNGYPIPVKFLRSLAHVIVRQRSSTFHIPLIDHGVKPPGKNWPQGFYKRHPDLKARRVKVLDWSRHDHSIYGKVAQWFTVIGKELNDPAIRQENVYNMDETGVLLSVLSSLKVLIGKDDLNCRGAGVKRTVVAHHLASSHTSKHLDHSSHS
jgi:Tc5 transposase DNA-binding domain